VTVIPGASATATVLEVRAADRLGLLHRIGGALVAAGVSVRSAHVETLAGQASDTFYLTDSLGGPLPATLAERVVVGVTLAISEQRP
jgi:[protein-PII] uridylyltransferase